MRKVNLCGGVLLWPCLLCHVCVVVVGRGMSLIQLVECLDSDSDGLLVFSFDALECSLML